MPQIYYKIIRNINNRLFSSQASLWDPIYRKYSVEYFINKYVSPNVQYTKLMVFDSLENVMFFTKNVGGIPNIEIFSCQIREKCKYAPFAYHTSDIEYIINKFIKDKIKFAREQYKKHSPPIGTIFCDQVKLLKRIS